MRTIFPSSVSGSRSPVCVRMPVADLVGQVEAARDPVTTARCGGTGAPKRSREHLVERVLARVAERRVPHVVAEPDRLDEVLVQPQRPGDDPRDRGRLERVRHPRPVVVALRVDEDLRLPLQPPERLRVDDPVAVALERRPHGALLLRRVPAARLVRAHGERREALLLVLADSLLEGVTNSPGQLGHRA